MTEPNNGLLAISPIDGRYQSKLYELNIFFSEFALIKYRLRIEIEYVIALSKEKQFTGLTVLSTGYQTQLRKIYQSFTAADAETVKSIEAETRHDVKAVEYYLQQKLAQTRLKKLIPWIHFALTSEDVNNLAYSLMWQEALRHVHIPNLKMLYRDFRTMARRYKDIPLLAMTHGQPATPTTVGKELAVFAQRLDVQLKELGSRSLQGKLSGATGTWGAHQVSYPIVNWPNFSKRFVKSLGLEPNLLTTQIEPHDSLAASFHTLMRINTILLDFCRDMWMYISRGVFQQKAVAGEVGSSTMPHKINPIQFENAEGNLGLANALLQHLAQKLPVSRLQRDLSDSTAIRSQGVGMAHSLLAVKNITSGLKRLVVNKAGIDNELNQHWEVLAEAIQTILRKNGREEAYEELKALTRGHSMDQETLVSFVRELNISEDDKRRLLELLPQTYLGLASKLVELL